MDRRFVGIVMMSVILVAVLCVPGLLGRNLGGSATPAVHVDAPLRVGDCLAPLDTPEQLNSVVDLVPTVPCSQSHSAEVLAVGRLDRTTRPTVSDPTFTTGSLSQQCDQLAGRFLGWGTKTALPRIQVSFFTRLTVPGALEWQLGQRWYSCELMPGLLDYPISYRGTAADASFRTPPGAFANCSDGPGTSAVSCDRPHHAEQLTRTYRRAATAAVAANSATGADTTCIHLAGQVIGTVDPTFGGQLAVLTRAQGGASECWVTTTSNLSLTSTLINHGSGRLSLR
jgi:hypothetical protein